MTSASGVVYYPSSEGPSKALDQNSGTKYILYGNCTPGVNQSYCGINNGFYISPQYGASLLLAIQFVTGGDQPKRDPLTITIEGSNATSSALMLGTSWSLIYNGSTGLDINTGRQANGPIQCIYTNTRWYNSYRILVTLTRNVTESVEYSEVKLLGHINPNQGTCM